jgi:hypothetical protein
MATYYLDCEFDGLGGPLLSLALIKQTVHRALYVKDKALYLVNEYAVAKVQDVWVNENVVPVMDSEDPFLDTGFYLNRKDVTYKYATGTTNEQRHWSMAGAIEEFLKDDPEPTIIADWPDDFKYFSELLITGPGTMINIPTITFKLMRVDAYPNDLVHCVQHHALCDAYALMAKCRN